MKGLKLRTPPIESIIEAMKALGANPVSIPYGDTYMALKTNVADGQENPLANIGDMKFFEVQKYMTMIDYQFHRSRSTSVWTSGTSFPPTSRRSSRMVHGSSPMSKTASAVSSTTTTTT